MALAVLLLGPILSAAPTPSSRQDGRSVGLVTLASPADAIVVPTHAMAAELAERTPLGDRIRVIPGAPRTAEWLQLAAPIRNPYFGAEMLDCGSEVKP